GSRHRNRIFVFRKDAGGLRFEEEKSVAEQKLIADRKRIEQIVAADLRSCGNANEDEEDERRSRPSHPEGYLIVLRRGSQHLHYGQYRLHRPPPDPGAPGAPARTRSATPRRRISRSATP